MKHRTMDKFTAQSMRRLGNPGVIAIAVALLTIGAMVILMLALGTGATR